MNRTPSNHEDQRLGEILEVISKFNAGDLTARGTLAEDGSALDDVIAGINILGERLEAKIADNQQAILMLSESEALFRTIFDSVQDGVVVADTQTLRFRMVNNSICHMLGYSRGEFLNLTVEDIHPEKDLPYIASEFKRMAGGGTALASNLPMKRKDGRVFYADASGGTMTTNGAIYLVGVFRDVSERMSTDEEIHQLNQMLQEKMRQLLEAQEELVRKEKLALLGQVAGIVGHELRNPLGVMNNAVYFLQTVLADADDTIGEYLRIIKEQVSAADCIVGDLLDSVRTKKPQPTTVSVKEIIDQTLHQNLVPSTMTVTLEIPEALPSLWVDTTQIQQVLRNLISNGVEAMQAGGKLVISASETSKDGTVSVSVRDNGCGMSPEVLARLFQPLFTTKARGIGLGMVVVNNLTQSNGGTIKVESAVGRGTTFTVVLPTINSASKVP